MNYGKGEDLWKKEVISADWVFCDRLSVYREEIVGGGGSGGGRILKDSWGDKLSVVTRKSLRCGEASGMQRGASLQLG